MFIVFVFYLPYICFLKYSKKSIHDIYNLLKTKVWGITAFNKMIAYMSPYSGNINAIVEEFNEHKTKCTIKETKSLKNPFNSIHAIALANLGEMTSGLLMSNYLHNNNKKGIITNIKIDYYKKARGTITAVCNIESLNNNIIKSDIHDETDTLICEVFCKWNIKQN